MNPQLKSLIELQAIDNQIGELEHEKAAIPKQDFKKSFDQFNEGE